MVDSSLQMLLAKPAQQACPAAVDHLAEEMSCPSLPTPLRSTPQRESVREGAKEELAKRKSKREGLSKDAQRRLAALGACGRVAGWVGCVW